MSTELAVGDRPNRPLGRRMPTDVRKSPVGPLSVTSPMTHNCLTTTFCCSLGVLLAGACAQMPKTASQAGFAPITAGASSATSYVVSEDRGNPAPAPAVESAALEGAFVSAT